MRKVNALIQLDQLFRKSELLVRRLAELRRQYTLVSRLRKAGL